MLNASVTEAAIVREMDADELFERAREIYNRPIELFNYAAYQACKRNYKQITGHEMPTLVFLIESV